MSRPEHAWDGGPRSDVVICATGARNGLAWNSHQTWAFWRADATALSESPFRCANGTRATFVSVRDLPTEATGLERLWPMLRAALDEVAPALDALPRPVPVVGCLCAPAPGPETSPEDRRATDAITRAVAAEVSVWGASHGVRGPVLHVPRGHASMAFALLEAAAAVASGKVKAVLLAGVDSHYTPQAMDALIARERLFDGENVDSLIPGEGAAVLLLTRENVARAAGLTPLARVLSVGTGSEPGTLLGDAPCTGRGLTDALRGALAPLRARGERFDWLVGDVTHESYRATELQLALPRATAPGGLDSGGRDFRPVVGDKLRRDFLPMRFGDLGAATLPTGAVLVSQALARGAPRATRCLLFASSETQDRGAVMLGALEEGRA